MDLERMTLSNKRCEPATQTRGVQFLQTAFPRDSIWKLQCVLSASSSSAVGTHASSRKPGSHLLGIQQQVVELDGEKLEITATVVDSAKLERWLRWFGDAISHVHRESQNLAKPTVAP